MSIRMFERILREINVSLQEMENKMLYEELTRYFGIAGSYRECEKLEDAWNTPEYRKAIKDYIFAWLEFRKKRREMIAYA